VIHFHEELELTVRFLALTFAALLIAAWNHPRLPAWGQGLSGMSRWERGAPPVIGRPNAAPVGRRWRLYFPPDWRHPAIIRPPVKIYLDPPYGWEDPFQRNRGVGEPANSPTQPPSAEHESRRQAAKRPTRSKVFELNPQTGRLEERTVSRPDASSAPEIEQPPVPPPAKAKPP
jgi:hypothetical protein